MDFYGSLFHKVIFPSWESVIRRRKTHQILSYLEKTQYHTREELDDLQVGALKRLLHHVYEQVPFYRDRMRQVGMLPGDLKSRNDLLKLPIVTREEVQGREAERSASRPRPVIRKSTSGTSGRPLAFGYDTMSEYWRQAIKLRGYGWSGYHVGQKTLHYWGAGIPSKQTSQRLKIWADRRLKRELYLDCADRSDAKLREVVQVIQKVRPEIMLCYAQAGADLARYVMANNIRNWNDFPVICGAEMLFDEDRKIMQQAFGPEVCNTYGSREFMLIATECEAHDGFHISMENLLVEIIVRQGSEERPAVEGEVGDVVVTDLHNYGMPFVRYANGDRAVQGGIEPCPCGRHLTKIKHLEGRTQEMLVAQDGGKYSGILVNVLMVPVSHAVRHFQAMQHPDKSITLKVVPGDAWNQEIAQYLTKSIASKLRGIQVRIEAVETIPLSPSGKRATVVIEKAAI